MNTLHIFLHLWMRCFQLALSLEAFRIISRCNGSHLYTKPLCLVAYVLHTCRVKAKNGIQIASERQPFVHKCCCKQNTHGLRLFVYLLLLALPHHLVLATVCFICQNLTIFFFELFDFERANLFLGLFAKIKAFISLCKNPKTN